MKSERKKTNASRQARSQLHLSEGVATKRQQYVTDLTQLQIVPESSFSTTDITFFLFILLPCNVINVFQTPTYCTIYLLDKTHVKIRTSDPLNFLI